MAIWSKTCPNCGRRARGAFCQWCHYQLGGRIKTDRPPVDKRSRKQAEEALEEARKQAEKIKQEARRQAREEAEAIVSQAKPKAVPAEVTKSAGAKASAIIEKARKEAEKESAEIIAEATKKAEKVKANDQAKQASETSLDDARKEAEKIRDEAKKKAEQEAEGILTEAKSKAQREAADMAMQSEKDAKKEATDLINEAWRAAEEETAQILKQAKEEAEKESAEIIAEAKAEAEQLVSKTKSSTEKSERVQQFIESNRQEANKQAEEIKLEARNKAKQEAEGILAEAKSQPESATKKTVKETVRETSAREEDVYRLVNSSTDGIIVVNRSGIVVFANPAAEALFKQKNRKLVGNMFDFPIIPGEATEVNIGNGSDQERIVEIEVAETEWKEDEVYLVSVRDITKRKQAETALAESEERFRSIVENSHEGIIILDDNYKLIYVNDELCRISGYSPDDILEQDFRKFLDEESKQLIAERYVKRQKGEEVPPRYEFNFFRKDGEKRHVELSSAVIKDSAGKVKTVAQLIDITERRQTEQMANSLMNSPQLGTYIVQDGKFKFVNSTFAECVGYKKDELIGKDSLSLVHPDHRDEVRKNAVDMLKGKSTSPYEFMLVTKDGKSIWVMESVISIEYEGSRAALSNFMNINERKQTEEALKKGQEWLEYQDNEKLEFISVIGHELKTPLTTLITSANLLSDELAGDKDNPQTMLVTNIENAAHSMDERLNDLLNIAKLRVSELVIQPRAMDIEALIEQTVNQFNPTVQKRKQTLTLESTSLPKVMADPQRIEQVLLNLLTNAAKSSPQEGKIVVRARKEDDNVVVEIEDNGPGLSEEAQGRLFKPYYRTESDRQQIPGLGLGFALSKRLLEEQGGKLWLNSEVGKGSTFSFSLPVIGKDKEAKSK